MDNFKRAKLYLKFMVSLTKPKKFAHPELKNHVFFMKGAKAIFIYNKKDGTVFINDGIRSVLTKKYNLSFNQGSKLVMGLLQCNLR